MNFVFLMDPLDQIHPAKDTTLVLMREAERRGHEVFFLPADGLVLEDSRLSLHVTSVRTQDDPKPPFLVGESRLLPGEEADVVWIRTDPPFDERYLRNTWLLEALPDSAAVLNRPSGIRSANEKIWATRFPDLMPPTLIAGRRADLLGFLEAHPEAIAKPIDGFGGQGVFRISRGGSNVHVILETLTRGFTRPIVLQSFVPAARDGDKRILLLDGDPLGAVLRVHAQDDHRNNFYSGGRPSPARMTPRDEEIINALRPHLRAAGLYLTGIDILGDFLIEVNVTSPTCLQEIDRLDGVRKEEEIIDFAEALRRNGPPRDEP